MARLLRDVELTQLAWRQDLVFPVRCVLDARFQNRQFSRHVDHLSEAVLSVEVVQALRLGQLIVAAHVGLIDDGGVLQATGRGQDRTTR